MKKDGWRVEEETRWNEKVTAGRKDERIRKSGEEARESMMERDARDDGKGKGEKKEKKQKPIRGPKSAQELVRNHVTRLSWFLWSGCSAEGQRILLDQLDPVRPVWNQSPPNWHQPQPTWAQFGVSWLLSSQKCITTKGFS